MLKIKIGKANGLSKRPDWKMGMDNDNKNQKLIKEKQVQEIMEVVVKGPKEVIKEKIKRVRGKYEEVVKVVEEMKKAEVQNLRGDKWEIEEYLVLKKGKVYVLKDEELRVEIIQLHYDVLIIKHGGRWKMMELVARSYKKCWEICRGILFMSEDEKQNKGTTKKLMMNEVPKKAWMHLIVDFITKLPLVAGKDTILVVCNKLSKMVYFVATINEILVEDLARLFRNNVQKLHKLLKSVINDRGPQFVVELTKELNKILEIEIRLSTVFYLQMDRQTE